MGRCFRWFFSSSFSWLPNGRGNMTAFFPYCKSIKACENFWQEPLAQCVIWSQSCPSIIFIPLVKIFAVSRRRPTLLTGRLHSKKKSCSVSSVSFVFNLGRHEKNTQFSYFLHGILFPIIMNFLISLALFYNLPPKIWGKIRVLLANTVFCSFALALLYWWWCVRLEHAICRVDQ